jgi:hypothetical protein
MDIAWQRDCAFGLLVKHCVNRLEVACPKVTPWPLHTIPQHCDNQSDNGRFDLAGTYVCAFADDRHVSVAPFLRFGGDRLVPPSLRVDQPQDCIVGELISGANQR